MAKQPLYPHVPKKKEPLFPHGTAGQKPEEFDINLLAKTEGDPISKYCCSICGDCAPEDLLEEGRFLDRITWLREHYQEKHPGKWGEMAPMTIAGGEMAPMTIAGGEMVSPEYRNLIEMVDDPLPPEAY